MDLRAKKWVSRYHASHKQLLQFKPFVAAALPISAAAFKGLTTAFCSEGKGFLRRPVTRRALSERQTARRRARAARAASTECGARRVRDPTPRIERILGGVGNGFDGVENPLNRCGP